MKYLAPKKKKKVCQSMLPSLVVLFDLHLWVSLKGYGNAKKRKELMKEISTM